MVTVVRRKEVGEDREGKTEGKVGVGVWGWGGGPESGFPVGVIHRENRP